MPIMNELYVVPIAIKNRFWTDNLLVPAESRSMAIEFAKTNLESLRTVTGLDNSLEFEVGPAQTLEEYVGAN